jgi:tetratricopeptide (TPR) repeat protein
VVSKKDKYLASAQKLLERGSLDKALADFLKAAQEDQKDTRTWLRIAEIHVKRGENTQATTVYLKTAELYVEQGFFQRAVAVYKNVLKLTPGHTDAHFRLADVYKQLGLFSDAAQQYDHAATAFQRAGQLKQAISAIAQIVEMNPDQVMSRVRLAELAAQAGNNDDAIREFGRAAEQLEEQGRTDDYLRVAERLLVIQPDNFALARKIAVRHLERQNPKGALSRLEACYKADAKDPDTLNMLATTFEQLGQADKALSSLKQLANVYEERRMVSERNQIIQRIHHLDPSDPVGRGERAGDSRPARRPEARSAAQTREVPITFSELDVPATVMQSRPEMASGSVETAPDLSELEHEQTQAEVRRILTETDIFVKYGLCERAAEHVRKVFSLKPDHTGAHERLIAILIQLGRKAEAVEELGILADRLLAADKPAAERHLRRALELDPNATGARRMLDRLNGETSAPVALPDLEESLELELPSPDPGEENPPSADAFEGSGFVPISAPAGGSSDPDWEQVPPAAQASPLSEEESGSDEEEFGGFLDGLDMELDEATPTPPPAMAPPPPLPPPPPAPPALSPSPAPTTFDEFEIDLDQVTPLPVSDPAPPQRPQLASSQAGPPSGMRQPVLPPPRRPTPPGPIAPPPRPPPAPVPEAELDPNVSAELEQVDFFIEQTLADDARQMLDEINPAWADHPEVRARRERLETIPAPEGTPLPVLDPEPSGGFGSMSGSMTGAVPTGSFAQEFPTGSTHGATIISPRAVLPGGDADSTTQRDLGIAYKEMGLYDAAVAEFAKLVDDPDHEVFALTMMGECYEARGAPAEALLHYKKALNRPQARDEEATQLYYQLGRVFHTLGDQSEALYFFEKVARRSPHHEDVAQRIQTLRAQGVAPPQSAAASEERPRLDAARGSNSNRR